MIVKANSKVVIPVNDVSNFVTNNDNFSIGVSSQFSLQDTADGWMDTSTEASIRRAGNDQLSLLPFLFCKCNSSLRGKPNKQTKWVDL